MPANSDVKLAIFETLSTLFKDLYLYGSIFSPSDLNASYESYKLVQPTSNYGLAYFEHLRSNLELPSTLNVHALRVQACTDPQAFIKALEEVKMAESPSTRFGAQRKQRATKM